MEGKNKQMVGIVLILCCLFASTVVWAEYGRTISVGDVNTNFAGDEIILPYLLKRDFNGDGIWDRLSVRFDVYQTNSNTKLYSSAITASLFYDPATFCNEPMNGQSYEQYEWGTQSGKWVAVAINLRANCTSADYSYSTDSQKLVVYIADVSESGQPTRKVTLANSYPKAVDFVDTNNDGIVDALMIATSVSQNIPGISKTRIYTMDLETGSVISNNKYVTSKTVSSTP